MNSQSFLAIDTATSSGKSGSTKRSAGRSIARTCLPIAETGMEIRLVRYPAGVINPPHTHPCGHGMYVLEGTLVTHRGSFGPGSFVWFPEGEVMEHGASADGDVTVVFITNKHSGSTTCEPIGGNAFIANTEAALTVSVHQARLDETIYAIRVRSSGRRSYGA